MTEEQQQEQQAHDCTRHAIQRLSNHAHVQEQNWQQLQRYHANMTEEQQQEQQARDCTRHAIQRLSNHAHVQEQNWQQFQRYCANMTEEQQQEQQAHDHTRHAIQRLSNHAHVQGQNCCQSQQWQESNIVSKDWYSASIDEVVEALRDKGADIFQDAGKNPSTAVLLYYINSGCLKFQEWKEYDAMQDGQEYDIKALCQEIRNEQLLEMEIASLIEQ